MATTDPKNAESASQAAESVRSAEAAMKEALAEGQKNQREAMGTAQERAAKALEQSAMRARESAKRAEPRSDSAPSELGAALESALRAMRAAREQLGQGRKPGDAEPQMRRAADALGEAAQSGQDTGSKPGRAAPGGVTPGGNDGAAEGAPDLRTLGPEAAKYAGRPWGELPGDVRTRLIQDWTARYGADYARNIRFYFEQLAERK